MKSLVVGMGIGNLYKQVLTELGYEVITVDSNPEVKADFTDVEPALLSGPFDTAHICTPNYTHEAIARLVAPLSNIVFIEKPGVESESAWLDLTTDYPITRFMMVKNNMWRDNIAEMRDCVEHAKTVKIRWINKNRIPAPGTWFTTKELAYGGVSRDLMPHLLSLYIALNDEWETGLITGSETRQLHTLESIGNTDYGLVKRDGTYDVDDLAKIKFMKNGRVWKMEANWADGKEDNRSIDFEMNDDSVKRFELGLCPEEAYKSMIHDAVSNVDNNEFWLNQYKQDSWIHRILEKL